MRSTAFDTIEDPNDPAWAGHAAEHAPRGGRARMLVALGVLVLAAAVIAVVVLRGGDGDERLREADRASDANVRPSAVIPEDLGDAGLAPIEPEAEEEPVAAAPATTGSGWAPQAATQQPWSSEWLKGDMIGVAPVILQRLEAVARELDRPITVVSGWRTTHEQNELYQRYRNGTGNLAAPPGYSNHESGRAADVYVDGVALASVDGAAAIAAAHGLHFPVGGEPWHAELMGS